MFASLFKIHYISIPDFKKSSVSVSRDIKFRVGKNVQKIYDIRRLAYNVRKEHNLFGLVVLVETH